MVFRLSDRAEADIARIAIESIEMFGVTQSRRYRDGLVRTLDLLQANPRIARLRNEVSPPVRVHRYRSHVIVYEEADQGDILILRIRHGREDWLGDPAG